jgi:hypothetical protein
MRDPEIVPSEGSMSGHQEMEVANEAIENRSHPFAGNPLFILDAEQA